MTESARVPGPPLRTLAVLAACLGAALLGAWLARGWLAGPDAPPATEVAAVYARPRPLPPFNLIAHDGSRFDAARLRGHYTLLLFGFTQCPDLCPTTLVTLAAAGKLLADLPAARRPAVVLVSVDPARDTPPVLARYVPHFDPAFIGVTGDADAIAAFALALGAAFQRGAAVDGSYTVDHTAALFLVDPEVRLLAVFPTPHVAAPIAADYRRILAARKDG
jgi:protein SCO1/2